MDDLLDQFKKVRLELEKLRSPQDFPSHLVWRLAVAVAGETVQHVDCDLATASPRLVSGSVVVFTDKRVILAQVADSPLQVRAHDSETFTVHLETWKRSALRTVVMAPDRENWRNSDSGWTNVASEENFPRDLSVSLCYDGREAITLPLLSPHSRGIRTGMLFDFLPKLLGDISA